MLPDYRGARALQEMKLAAAAEVRRNGGGRHRGSRLEPRLETRLHRLIERQRERITRSSKLETSSHSLNGARKMGAGSRGARPLPIGNRVRLS